jgi:hypothetical protein
MCCGVELPGSAGLKEKAVITTIEVIAAMENVFNESFMLFI